MALFPISRAANPFSLMKRLFLALDIAIVYKFNSFISISNLNALDTAFIDIATRIISLSFEVCGIVEGSIVFGFCDGITTADDDIGCDSDTDILAELVTDGVPLLSSVYCDESPGDKIGVCEAAKVLNDGRADGNTICDKLGTDGPYECVKPSSEERAGNTEEEGNTAVVVDKWPYKELCENDLKANVTEMTGDRPTDCDFATGSRILEDSASTIDGEIEEYDVISEDCFEK